MLDTNASDHRRTRSTSATSTPRIAPITRIGTGAANRLMSSTRPSATKPSMSSSTSCSAIGRHVVWARFDANHRLIRRRCLVWAGGSRKCRVSMLGSAVA